MREIIFRGQKSTKEWVIGNLIFSKNSAPIIIQAVNYPPIHTTSTHWSIDAPAFCVIPETIGQFTGLLDKNGKKIFEGDVLQLKTMNGRIERFKVVYAIHRREMKSGWTVAIPSFAFVSSDNFPSFPIVKNYLSGHDLDIIEVSGNIHDNP